ncbi:hypothetical protein [Spongiivirga citrea]|uniref:DUF4251 domain-containing protein n=1 Tax=Spongiivirga citrea TaxID=1481457 RepID=A0A6M0CI11_9FLAO|nr:hypothetical protein [Spongiivirga citrea]NER17515.1 hypothetical protein [Spongiivirga citrea]
MKAKILVIAIFFLFTGQVHSQTQEQQEQIEKAKRMLDSIKNLPQYKEAMERAKNAMDMIPKSVLEKGREENLRRKQQKEEEKKALAAKNKISREKGMNEYYWRNRIASDTAGKFENWSFGNVEIRSRYRNKEMKWEELKMGTISSDGTVNIKLPAIDTFTLRTMNQHQHETEMVLTKDEWLTYSNPNTGYFSTRFTMDIFQGEKRLGTLSLGNDVVPVVNLNSPFGYGKPGDGYTAFWVYVSETNSITGTKSMETANPNDAGKITHNLHFKQGWNIIKVKVSGKINTLRTGKEQWKNKEHTAMTSLPSDCKFFFLSPEIKH